MVTVHVTRHLRRDGSEVPWQVVQGSLQQVLDAHFRSGPRLRCYVVDDQGRIPEAGRFVLTRTRDGGSRFEPLTRGLPLDAAYNLVYRHGIDPDATGNRVAVGSTSGGVWVSEDGGDGWMPLAVRFPPVWTVQSVRTGGCLAKCFAFPAGARITRVRRDERTGPHAAPDPPEPACRDP